MMNTTLSVALALSLMALPARALAQVTLYGEPGTFGTIGSPLPSGQSLTLVPHAEFDVTRGRAAFFTATTSDGTVFAAGFQQNVMNASITSCYMSITCLNPNAATCYDAASGENRNSSEILVLTRDGYPSIPRDESLCLTPNFRFTILAGGADVTDIQVVRTESGEERVAFASMLASLGNSDLNGFPMLGFLKKQDGSWRLDSDRQHWRDEIASSSPAGAIACPNADCGAVAEMAFFSESQTIVYGTYARTSQRLVVVDLDGVVQAQYQIPHPGNRCTPDPDDTILWLGIRQVETDPTAPLGDERVALTVDGSTAFQHPFQEFRYDDATKTLEPVTNLVNSASAQSPPADCTNRGSNANYDADGNMIVSGNLIGGNGFHVYMKDPATGRRSIEDNCPFTGYTEANVGTPCFADLTTGQVVAFGPPDGTPIWTHGGGYLISSEADPLTGILTRVENGGYVDLIDTFRENDRTIYVSYAPVNLWVTKLPKAEEPDMGGLIGWKGIVNRGEKSLWVPIASTLPPVVPGCDGIFCDRYANEDLPSWLYEVKYEQVLNGGLRALDAWITRPYVDRSSSAFIGFYIRANHQSTALSAQSGFWLFPEDSAEPVLVRQISRSNCSGGQCDYGLDWRQSWIDDQPAGEYTWSLVVTSSTSGEHLHAQGVIEVQ